MCRDRECVDRLRERDCVERHRKGVLLGKLSVCEDNEGVCMQRDRERV